MKESIFFNRKQLGIIRWYMFGYRMIFDYGVRVFSGIFSLLFLIPLFITQVFSFDKEAEMADLTVVKDAIYRERTAYELNAKSFLGIELIHLGGAIISKDSQIQSQDNVLKIGSLILPRFVANELDELKKYSILYSGENYSNQDFANFFQYLFVKPLKLLQTTNLSYQKYQISTSIWDYFGLDCLNTTSSMSFVCQDRLDRFLSNFYLINLSADQSSSFSEQLGMIFQKIQYKKHKRKLFCDSMLKFMQYGGTVDLKITEMMYSCDVDSYKQYQQMKDFSEINFGFHGGLANGKIYVNQDLNLYKLYSLQQMIYKQMASAVEVESYAVAYSDFIKNLLIQETQRGNQGLDLFSRRFTSWFNTNILIPYLRDDGAKVSPEQKNELIASLLLIENGDKNGLFNGLNKSDVDLVTGAIEEIPDENIIDLETLFKGNIPNQFLLTSLKSEVDHLVVNGEDQVTNVQLSAIVGFDGASFYVQSLTIEKNKTLEEFVNTLLKTDKYSFAKMLILLKDNLEIAQQSQPLKIDICNLAKEDFGDSLVSCSDTLIKIEKGNTDSESGSGILYQFVLKDGVLRSVKISDKLLATHISQELDFSKVNKDTTFAMIKKIISYEQQNQNSGFGAKEQILVNDNFIKYFKKKPNKIEIIGNVVKVYFTVKEINFIGQYDIATNRLSPISLDFGNLRRPIIVQRLEFILNSQDGENLNAFLLDPLAYLKKLNSRLVDKYFKDGKLITSKEQTFE